MTSTFPEREPLLVEVRVKNLGVDRRTEVPVVLLQELDGDRVLPIFIGPSEAYAISVRHMKIATARPLTSDLLASVIGRMDGKLDRIVIDRVEDSTYYAELFVQKGDEVLKFDARPSDSIALALRLDAPIFAHSELFEAVTIEVTEDPSVVQLERHEEAAPLGMSGQELQEHLRRLNPQDFGRFTP